MAIDYAIAQIVGRRDRQEDYCAIEYEGGCVASASEGLQTGRFTDGLIAVLCDGMGGHNAGDVAAQLAATTFLRVTNDLLNEGEIINQALVRGCLEANKRIGKEVQANPALSGMGTTIVGICVGRNKLSWVSVGDSHLLLFRKGKLVKLNQDHSMRPIIAKLVDDGALTAEVALNHPDRHGLRSALTGENIHLIDRGLERVSMHHGDIVIVASDGIDGLGQSSLRDVLQTGSRGIRVLANTILKRIVDIGDPGQDNASILLFRLRAGTRDSLRRLISRC